MIDPILKKLDQKKLLDWGMLLFAWKGIPDYDFMDCKVLNDDIVDFAIKQIEKKEDYVSPTLIELYSAGVLSKEEVTMYLEDICEEENLDLELSYKRWRLLMIEVVIEWLYEEYFNYDDYSMYDIDGLNILRDVWLAWNEPQDVPYYTYEYKNIISDNFNTQEYYEQLLKAHKSWIEQEKQKLF